MYGCSGGGEGEGGEGKALSTSPKSTTWYIEYVQCSSASHTECPVNGVPPRVCTLCTSVFPLTEQGGEGPANRNTARRALRLAHTQPQTQAGELKTPPTRHCGLMLVARRHNRFHSGFPWHFKHIRSQQWKHSLCEALESPSKCKRQQMCHNVGGDYTFLDGRFEELCTYLCTHRSTYIIQSEVVAAIGNT